MREGLLVEGVIEAVELHTVPSKFAGEPGRVVTRVSVAIERAVRPDGGEADRRLFTTPFQGPPELAATLAVGQAVRIETTTATGLHIARIDARDASAGES